MKGKSLLLTLFLLVSPALPGQRKAENVLNTSQLLDSAARQYLFMKEMLKESKQFPKTYNPYTDRLQTSPSDWWCSGFYPGTLFYLYEATGKPELLAEGQRMLALLEKEQYNVDTHDIGFMMYCSYGNANRIAPRPEYRDILIRSAKSLITRFNPKVGCIKSHNRRPEDFVVIIDNMMNLELLMWATEATGDSAYYQIAVAHANTTLKNHFRADNSLYHGINYHPETGNVMSYQAGQGYAEQSAWARGQAWGLYGYTLMYRYTKDADYLNQAIKIAEFQLNHPNMPEDLIPYWDYDAPNIPNTLRDASAAAINASGLLKLSRYVPEELSKKYWKNAESILRTLSSPRYMASFGTNGGFLLMHSVGNIPAMTELDVPLAYADYYYIEALNRYKQGISPSDPSKQKAEIDLLTSRLQEEYLKRKVKRKELEWSLKNMQADGSWSDIDYNTVTLLYDAGKHLDRLVNMALAYSKPGSPDYHSQALRNKIVSGLEYFFQKQPVSENWWHIDVGAPQEYMIVLLLLKKDLEKDLLLHYSSYLQDRTGNLAHQGKNRTWVSSVTIHKGCIEDNYELIKTGFESIASTIRIVSERGAEGVKSDYSIHQHRPQLYSGGYGMALMDDLAWFIGLVNHLSFAELFTPEKREILANTLLQGTQLFGYRDSYDFGTIGRGISRSGALHNISTETLDKMIRNDPANASAYRQWKEHITNKIPFPAPGNKYFWESAIMTHHGANYYLSAKIISTRTNGTEMLNNENLKGYYLPLGATNILTTGNEYKDIFPSWDWTRVPGTTGVAHPSSPSLGWYLFGSNAFGGGVSNSKNGLIAYEHSYNGIQAKKAYFFLGDAMLCMGTGIEAYKTQMVTTSVNQCFLTGSVFAGYGGKTQKIVQTDKKFTDPEWIYHDNVGYIFLGANKVALQQKDQTGSWRDINGTGSKTPVTQRVFSLWVEHGTTPRNESYCYVVMPGRSLTSFEKETGNHGFRVICNTTDAQAVINQNSNVGGVVFYHPGTIALSEELKLSADKKVLLYWEKTAEGYELSAADPLYSQDEVTLRINGEFSGDKVVYSQGISTIRVAFPQGDFTGRSVRVSLKTEN
ncbi:MAG: glycoside hydrolase family 88 protein [Dysgonamonadaceae bacterium]|jgi:chondroitin AC lyase|nr:glycoside hydrolase family 88 protein [Dysgonamonadaceae bacterium]